MQIELTKIGPVYQDGKLAKMEIEYTRDGKKASRKLAAVGKTKDVMQAISKMEVGDAVEVKVVKDGDFWNWEEATKLEGAAAAPAKTSTQGRSTFETPDERARRQVYIVRQSSISSAIEFLNNKGTKATVSEVLDVARTFASFVFSTDGQVTIDEAAVEKPVARKSRVPQDGDLQDDIPF